MVCTTLSGAQIAEELTQLESGSFVCWLAGQSVSRLGVMFVCDNSRRLSYDKDANRLLAWMSLPVRPAHPRTIHRCANIMGEGV